MMMLVRAYKLRLCLGTPNSRFMSPGAHCAVRIQYHSADDAVVSPPCVADVLLLNTIKINDFKEKGCRLTSEQGPRPCLGLGPILDARMYICLPSTIPITELCSLILIVCKFS